MKRLLIFIALLCHFFVKSQILTPVKWSFQVKKLSDDEAELLFIADIEKKWHLYSQDIPPGGPIPTTFNIKENPNFAKIGKVVEPKPKEEIDPNFDMKLKYFDNKVTFRQKIKVLTNKPFTIDGNLEFMCCDDSKCLPPQEVDFVFKLEGFNPKNSSVKNDSDKTIIILDTAKKVASSNDTTVKDSALVKTEILNKLNQNEFEDYQGKSLFWFFIISFLAGLAAIFTPCVFPMIPMTVTFFLKDGQKKSKARFEALIYGISIIAIYTIIGTIVALTLGANFANWLSTHWLPNIFFFLIFMVFAASFLGMFEIVLPSWLVTKVDKQSEKGGILGPFFMAFTLVLVSFSCTGPIVGAILVESAGGQILKPIVGMFGFSLAFAIPFTLFAFFPSWLANLPKSGGWLNSVKVVLGFIELALGLKFLSVADQTYHWGILDREIYIALWIVIFTLMGFYLLGKIKFAHDTELKYISVPRLALAIVTFAFVVYLIPGMWGAPLKFLSGYLPPAHSHDFDLNNIIRENAELIINSDKSSKDLCETPKYKEFLHLPHGLKGYFDYEQGMKCAKQLRKPVFIDFTGHGCVNCREMEANVWADPEVLRRLKNDYLIIALYVDDKTVLPENEWIVSSHDGKVKKTIGAKYADFQISRFGVNAQPYYVLLDYNGNLLTKPKAYDRNVENFIKFLDEGLKEFEKRKNKLVN